MAISRIDERYNAAKEEYPPQIGYCDMGDIDYNISKREAFVKGAEWGERAMIEKACNWIIDNFVTSDIDDYGDTSVIGSFTSVQSMIEDFQKAMEE